MKSHSNSTNSSDPTPLTIPQEIALTVCLGVYKKLIDNVKPSMGLVATGEVVVHEVLRLMLSGDLSIDITRALTPDTPRASIRAYISSAGSSDQQALLTELHGIILSPATPPYFKGFRKAILARLVSMVSRKSWGIGDVTHTPSVVVTRLGIGEVTYTTTISLRLK